MENKSPYVKNSERTLFRRCVQCPDDNPSCPPCGEDEKCSLQVKTCDTCAFTKCVKATAVNPGASTNGVTAEQSQPSPAGPIAGGVLGGIAFIAIVMFLLWRFCIKKRREQFESEWNDTFGTEKSGIDPYTMRRDQRASTHTVASIASTVYTRASNIIQIAYVPGVINRSTHSSPDLIPPVPPIPAASSPGSGVNSPQIREEDQHYFLPSDLRNSSFSSFTDRSSMARGSVASTVYRNNAIVSPQPAQAIPRLKPIPVSVKSSSKNSPAMSRSGSPPPSGSTGVSPKPSQQGLNTKSSIVGRVGVPRSITVTRKPSKSSTLAREHNVYELEGSGSEHSLTPEVGHSRRAADVSPQVSRNSSLLDDPSSDEEDSGAQADLRLINNNRPFTTIAEEASPVSPSSITASFRSTASRRQHRRSTSLNEAIQEAARKASEAPLHGGLGYSHHQPDASPFSDAHATGS